MQAPCWDFCSKWEEEWEKWKDSQSYAKLDTVEILVSVGESASGRSIKSAYWSQLREKEIKVFNVARLRISTQWYRKRGEDSVQKNWKKEPCLQ